MNTSDSIVIIPTYNEIENIEKIIRAVFGLEKKFDILIIDDGSPDGTAAKVKELMSQEFNGRLHLLERSGKLGLGTAYIKGFKWALERDYEYIFEMDADFSHDPPRRRIRCGYRFTVCQRSERGELAYRQSIDELFRIQIRALHNGVQSERHHCRIQMLQTPCARNHRTRQNQIQGICLPDRDEIHGIQDWLQDKGSAGDIRKQKRRRVENERRHLRRGILRRNETALGRMDKEIPENKRITKTHYYHEISV